MKSKQIYLKIFFIAIANITQLNTSIDFSLKSPELLNPKFLENNINVQKTLEAKGFKKYFFQTSDNLKLCGLLQDVSKSKKIKATIIYCAGFYPGRKEGMASFFTLFENEPYNFLLFDARGHNESEGSLFSYQNLKNYGTCEYQDIVAAVNFLNNYNLKHNITQNIIIHGICSGAFHSVKALDFLQNQDCNQSKNIKGIIFDSGWLEVTDIVEPTICAEIKKNLNGGWFSWLIKPLCYLTIKFYQLTLKGYHKNVTGICNNMKKVSCPILFVHCINDPYVPILPIQKFVETSACKHSWWIQHSSHANFHMHKPEEYKKKIMNFLDNLDYTSKCEILPDKKCTCI